MSDAYLGEIRLFAGDFAPIDWRFCNGDILSMNEYSLLYQVIGSAYGGDGQSGFALPDLRGRIPICAGAGVGLTPRAVGASGGRESVALTVRQLPSHSHSLNVSRATASTSKPEPKVTLASVASGLHLYSDTSQPTSGVKMFSPNAISSTGGGKPHNNIMPSAVLNYIICIQGEYPG